MASVLDYSVELLVSSFMIVAVGTGNGNYTKTGSQYLLGYPFRDTDAFFKGVKPVVNLQP